MGDHPTPTLTLTLTLRQAQLVAAMVVEAIEASLYLAISRYISLYPEPEPELGPEPLPGRCCDSVAMAVTCM